MEQQALLQPTQEMVVEEQLLGARSRRAPRVVLLLAALAAMAMAGKIAAPFLNQGASDGQAPTKGASTHDAVRLASEPEAPASVAPAQIANPQAADEKAAKALKEAAEAAKEAATEKAEAEAADAAKAAKEAAKEKAEAEAAEQAKVAAQALAAAEKLADQAAGFKKHSDDLLSNAKDLTHKTKDLQKGAADVKAAAKKDNDNADEAASHAEGLRVKAAELLKLAQGLDVKAAGLHNDSAAKETEAAKKEGDAEKLSQQATSLTSESKTALQQAVDTETKALGDTAASRMCINLPGVRLRGKSPKSFAPVVGNHSSDDDVECNDWCLQHEECQQSVFDWETKSCELFAEATGEPVAFKDTWPWHNSSYCGLVSEKDAMIGRLHYVYDQKPWVPPPHNCTWGADNCIETKCCADSCLADAMWTKCQAFTCWKQNDVFAGCKVGAAEFGWDGTRLGGHENREIEPAAEGKLVQGTRLYCFTVVMWNQPPLEAWMNSEAELANHWKEEGKGIMGCDDYSMFDGLEGGSVHNIQSFIRAWNMVRDDGRWKNNDWSIKVDADAVFFPDHLRKKIEWVYKTPQGSAVYLRNTFYKFQFLGALEVLTREALDIYIKNGWECEAKLGQEGGEDYWLLQCLEGLGIDFQTDVGLLHDKYAADESCNDPNSVGHHFYKKITEWDVCWNMAEEAWNNAHPQ